MDWSIMLLLAGMSMSKRRKAMTCMTCIKFHMALRDTARQIVTPN